MNWLLVAFLCVIGSVGVPQTRLHWDKKTLTLIQAGGLYGRIIRLGKNTLLCGYERAGACWVRKSLDNGKSWQPSLQVVSFSAGSAANPELTLTKKGRVLLLYNERPRDGIHRFSIRLAISRDQGKTWTVKPPVYLAGTNARNGCWEPAALCLPSGELQLFFANNYPHTNTDEQEISLCRSHDEGETWTESQTVSFRPGHRDGMPSPLFLANGRGLVFAIEDNGLPGSRTLQPAIIHSAVSENWKAAAIGADSLERWGAVTPPLPPEVYAGAPCLRQLSGKETLLSCQSVEGHASPQMAVYVGDRDAKNFRARSVPFDLPDHTDGQWNSLFVKDAHTVTALSSTTINGVSGLWAIDGHIVR